VYAKNVVQGFECFFGLEVCYTVIEIVVVVEILLY
jgi:hypothetical protein